MNRIRLTDAKVRDIAARRVPGRYRDDMIRAFYIEVNRWSASYKVQTTTKTRRTLRHTLGRVGEIPLAEARRKATELLQQIHSGDIISPVQLQPAKAATTLSDALRAFRTERDNARKSPVHTANVEANIRNHLGDWLELPIEKITRQMVVDRHASIVGDYAANHTIKQLRAVLNTQPDASNPVRRIPWRKPPPKRDEHGHLIEPGMTPEELPEWWRKVELIRNPYLRALYKLNLLSGMRPGELKKVRWAWVDLDRRWIHLPEIKAGRQFKVPLSAPMIAIIEELKTILDGPFLFPANSKTGHRRDIRDRKVRLTKGHKLRHTYVTVARAAPIPDDHRRLLVDHTIHGIHGQYGRLDAVFPRLLESQELISKALYFDKSAS